MFDKLRAWYAILSLTEKAREVSMDNGAVKPGWKTTEFWLTLIGNLPLIACTLGGHESVACLVAGVLSTLSYHYHRGDLKTAALDAAKKIAEESKEAPKQD